MDEERLNALSLVCIHRDIFLEYENIIDIYVSKYSRRVLLTNRPSENYTVEKFNASFIYAHSISKENLIVIRSLLKD